MLVQLSLAQICLDKGNIPDAIAALQSLSSLKNKPGLVATLVSLYEQCNNIDAAIKVFDDYVASLQVCNKLLIVSFAYHRMSDRNKMKTSI